MPLTQTNSNTGLWEAFCKTSNVVGVIILLLLLTEYQNEEYTWSYVRCDHQVLGQDVGKLEISQLKEETTVAFRVHFRITALCDVTPCNLSDVCQHFGVHAYQKLSVHNSPRSVPQICPPHLFLPVLEAPRKLRFLIVPLCSVQLFSRHKILCIFTLRMLF